MIIIKAKHGVYDSMRGEKEANSEIITTSYIWKMMCQEEFEILFTQLK